MQLKEPNKTIMHIDMNSFFASAEQQANPFLRNKSMGVGNPCYKGSAILAASYPAKAKGIGLATRLNEALRIDPKFELAKMDHIKYYDLHTRFIQILSRYCEQIEVYSIDEAFLDMTQIYLGKSDLIDIAFSIKQEIIEKLGCAITCSIGISSNKLLAKVASDYDKPDGISYIKWKERFKYLDDLKLQDVWGIGRHISQKMGNNGVKYLGQIRKMSDKTLYSIVGGYYKRLKLIANGYNFEPVVTSKSIKPPKSMQHAHTLKNATSNKQELKSLARKMSERLAFRLRAHTQAAQKGFVGFGPSHGLNYGWGYNNWIFKEFRMPNPTSSGFDIYKQCKPVIDNMDLAHTQIRRIVVGVLDLKDPTTLTFDDLKYSRQELVDLAFDQINAKYGSFTIRTADILYQYAKESELSSNLEEIRFHKIN